MPRTSEANQQKSEFCCDKCDQCFEKERQLELHQSLNESCLKLKAGYSCPICHWLYAEEQDRKVYKTADDFLDHLKKSQSLHIEQLAIEIEELKYKVEAKDIQVEQLARENEELKFKVKANDFQVVEDELEEELNEMLESFRKKFEEERSKLEHLFGNSERVDKVIKSAQHQSTALRDYIADIERLNSHIDDLIQQRNRLSAYIEHLEQNIEELNRRLYNVENIRYDGTTVFKISRYKTSGSTGTQECLCSSIFYTSPSGYKLRCQVFVNKGDPGTREYLSLSFIVVKGEFDDILEWPFKRKVTVIVKCIEDKSKDIIYTLTAENSSFQKPQSEENAPVVVPQLISVDVLDNPKEGFLAENGTLFVMVNVEDEVSSTRPEPTQLQEKNCAHIQMPGDWNDLDSKLIWRTEKIL